MMRGLQLIEKENAQLAHMLGMLLIVSEPPRKTSCPNNELPCLGIVVMGLLARKCIPRNFLQQSFANADPGYRKRAQIQISPEGDKRNRRDPHHVGAVAPYRIRLHSRAHVASQNVRQPPAQERELHRRQTMLSRPWRDVRQGLRVSAK